MISAARKAMAILKAAGYEAHWVGGYVRDLILGRKPKDIDIATIARPDQIMALFDKTIPVGAQFGIVIVVIDGVQLEIATYREDGLYGDSRRPDVVFYTDTIRKDVERRDFTIGGLAMAPYPYLGEVPPDYRRVEGKEGDDDTVIIDWVGGLADIEAKVIRCIGDPVARFTEDKLRMMRAVRFAAQLGFDIEAGTKNAIIHMASKINQVSRERIRDEMAKLLTADYATRGISLLFSRAGTTHLLSLRR